MRPFPASAVGTRPKMPSLTLWRRPGQREHTDRAVHSQGGGSWCPGAARQRSLVTGWVLCALAGDTSEEPGPPDPRDCDSPVPCATFPCTAGISGLCQLWHPISARLCHHPSSLLGWRQGVLLCPVGLQPSAQSPSAPGNVRVSGFPWQLPWGWWHVPHCALPARCGAVPRAAAPARPGSPGYL